MLPGHWLQLYSSSRENSTHRAMPRCWPESTANSTSIPFAVRLALPAGREFGIDSAVQQSGTIHMRALILFSSLMVSLLLVPLATAAELSYPVSLPTPKVESLQTSLSPTGGTVNVQLQVQYD